MKINKYLVLVSLMVLAMCVSCKPPSQQGKIVNGEFLAPEDAPPAAQRAGFLASVSNDALTDPELYDQQSAELARLATATDPDMLIELKDLLPSAKNQSSDKRAAAIMWCCQLFVNLQAHAIAAGSPLKRDTELERVLLEAFDSEDKEIKFQAAIGLAGIYGNSDAEEYAVHEYLHLENEDLDYLYWRQVTALGPNVPRLVARELVDGYEDVCLAFRLISRYQGDVSVEILISYIPTIDPAGIDCLAEAIAMLGDPRFARPLIARFRRDAANWDEPTRRWVITALGYCRHEAAIPILTDHLKSNHPVTRDAAAAGMRRIKPITEGELLEPYLLGVGDYAAYLEKVDDPLTGLVEEMKANPFLPADRQTRLLGTIEELLAGADNAQRQDALKGLDEIERGVLTPGAKDILTRILGE